jgi:hypothetical protein
MNYTVNLSIKYSDYPIAFFTRIFYLIRVLDLGIVQSSNQIAALKKPAGGRLYASAVNNSRKGVRLK